MENNEEVLPEDIDSIGAEVVEPVVEKPQVEVKEEPKVEPKAEVKHNDRHEALDPFSDTKQLDMEDEKPRSVISSGLSEAVDKLVDTINRLSDTFINTELTKEEREALTMAYLSARTTLRNNMYATKLNDNIDNFVNDINYGEKKYNPRIINFKDTGNEKISTATAVARLTSFLSVGSIIQVPLWHSGFWVTLKPPTQKEIINLELAIANEQVDLGRDTNTLIFSNYSAVFNKLLTEFIVDHISDTSIKIPGGNIKDITNYINVQDFNILVIGILDCLYPDGINIIRTCKNVLALVNDKPKCDYRAEAVLDPRKLIWLDRKALSPEMLSHMSKKAPESMSIDSVKEYQLSIQAMIDKEYKMKGENGKEVTIKFSLPSLAKYLEQGDKWVNDIITEAEGLFTDADTTEKRNDMIMDLTKTVMLASYNSFVKSIEAGGIVLDDPDGINDTLQVYTVDDDIYDSFINDIAKFIENSAIAIVATPSYTCPKCAADQTEDKTGPFKELIPLNVGEYFFLQCGLRSSKIRSRVG